MTFAELLVQVRELLQSKGRVSYRALKLQFNLDDDYLEGLKDELIEAERVAVDENGKVLVWVGREPTAETENRGNGESEKDSLGSNVQRLASKEQSPTPSTQSPAERRQLTVMFCDLVGSTALSTQLDPEELREVVRAYQETCAEVIRRYDGHIAQHLGDGLLVYFSYPVAHEDDAQRAVRTGLGIVEKIHMLSAPSPVPTGEGRGEGRLQVRIGIHTGLVVIGEIGSSEKREILAMGETPNLAARIQGQANPDEVMISAATYRLVEGLFTCEDRGQPELKGITTPLTLYRVVKEEEAQSRFEVVVRKGLTPLIGRDHEYGLLRERWARVKEGEGQVVLLSGEPGIGKSRLVEALKETVEHEGAGCLELRCSPYHQNSALHPVIEHVQRVLGFRPDDAPEEKLRKLELGVLHQTRGLSPLSRQLPVDTIPLLAALLSLPHPTGHPPLTLSPRKQKEKTHEALVAWLGAEARQEAVVYAWEDLHWADPSTLELLTLFLNQVPTTRLLAVLTFRPEFIPSWGLRSYLSQLTLNRLERQQVEVMVEQVTSGKALPPEVLQQIVAKTDGVPLFVEELTKMVVESALVQETDGHYELSRPLPPLAIPSTLQDSLMARLDRLGPAKEVAQLGATLGREFSYELIHAVSPLDEVMLRQGLRQFVDAELIYQRGLPPQATYLFKHALVQEAAYQSLLKSRRQQYHQQIAQVLEERFTEVKETQPELLAHHYTAAGLTAQAIPYWQRAGERATKRSAYVEAVAHLTKGLELLKTLPDTPERMQHELMLQITLGIPLVATKGYTAPEVEHACDRARTLCQQIGESPQLIVVLGGLYSIYFNRAEHKTAHELAEHLLRLAQSARDPRYLLWAHATVGGSLFYQGELLSARPHLEQGIALYDPQEHGSYGSVQDPGVTCLTWMAYVLWWLGYPDQALMKSQEALILARALSHPFSLAWALDHTALLHQFRQEEHLTKELAEACIALSTEQGFVQRVAWGIILRGWALFNRGEREEGLAQMQQGLAAYQATGADLLRPYFLALLAEAYGEVGQAEEGLRVLAEALALVNKTGEHLSEAMLYRLRGELTLAQSSVQRLERRVKEAEECFLKAIEIAHHQRAKSLELRATTSLARLWQQQGKQHEARDILAEIYGWFTEGFDTKDLQEAKALIEELGH